MPVASRIVPAALALLGLALPAAAGSPTVYTVNTTLDLPDATPAGDGVVDADLVAEGEQVTLRGAIQDSNALPGADEIVLPEGSYALTIKGALEDACATGDLDVTDDLTLSGAGATLALISGKKAKDRVFDVHAGQFVIDGVSISGGRAPKDDGSGQENGGGLRVSAPAELTLTNVVVDKNRAPNDGGGLWLDAASATLEDSVFSGNRSGHDGGGILVENGAAVLRRVTLVKNRTKDEGGGLENSGSVVSLENCTLTRNRGFQGGALSVEDASQTELVNCTLARNKAKEGSGIREGSDLNSQVTAVNTIIANKAANNFDGLNLVSLGHNIDNGSTCGFGEPTDRQDTDPRLELLADNGGLTPTMALKPDSPALDAGDDALDPDTDQRGLPRVDLIGPGPSVADIGAFELQELFLPD
jgi:predicted outer membrane repeat protein